MTDMRVLKRLRSRLSFFRLSDDSVGDISFSALLIVGVVSFSLYAVQRRERNKFRIRQIEEDGEEEGGVSR